MPTDNEMPARGTSPSKLADCGIANSWDPGLSKNGNGSSDAASALAGKHTNKPFQVPSE
ncbi:MAG: hypothetical protein KGL39_30550 [Patescibacteria group bacterium]|nr:hypothetical protein [Patescibacteria group bacterium]